MDKSLNIQEILSSYSLNTSYELRQTIFPSILSTQADCNIHKQVFNLLVEKSNKQLFGIFGGAFKTIHGELKPTEEEILDKLLLFVNIKLNCNCSCFSTNSLFKLNQEEKKKIYNIYMKLEKWFNTINKLNTIKSKQDKQNEINIAATDIFIKCNNYHNESWIIPMGFEKLNYSYKTSSTLEYSVYWNEKWLYPYQYEPAFNQEHCGAIIVKNTENKLNLAIIDPLSPYIPRIEEEVQEKIGIGLMINDVNMSKNFIESTIKLKIIKPSSGYYQWSNFYEALLPEIQGKIKTLDYEKDYLDCTDFGVYMSSLLCIKHVMTYLFREEFAELSEFMLKKVFFEFEFTLLNQYRGINDICPTLLNEMSYKISHDTSKLIDLKILDKDDGLKISKVIEDIEIYKQAKLNQQLDFKREKSFIGDLSYDPIYFRIDPMLHDYNFIKSKLKSNVTLTSNLIQPQNLKPSFIDIAPISDRILQFNAYVLNLKKNYNLNLVIQLHSSIEEFVLDLHNHSIFELNQNEFTKQQIENISSILINIAKDYYSCTFRIMSEIYKNNELCYYDPSYYIKLVLCIYTIYMIIDNWARSDLNYQHILKEYGTSTSFSSRPEPIFYQLISNNMIIPDKAWLICKQTLKKYFLENNKTPYLFTSFYGHSYHENADQNVDDVKFIIKLLQAVDPIKYTEIQKNTSCGSQKTKLWQDLVFSNNYLPKLLISLREISFISRHALLGFSMNKISQIQKDYKDIVYNNKTGKYLLGLFPSSSSYHPNNLPFKDDKRYIDFILPKGKEKYQNTLMNSKILTENEILANQHNKPDELEKPEFLYNNFMNCNKDITFHQLYIAIKENRISFDREEDYYYIKMITYQLSIEVDNEQSYLEKLLKMPIIPEKLIEIIINQDINKIIERLKQINCQIHILDIILCLYNSAPINIKKFITKILDNIRYGDQNKQGLETYLNKQFSNNIKENKWYQSMLSVYCILTFESKPFNELDAKDAYLIIQARKIIADNYNSEVEISIPEKLYYKMMRFMVNTAQTLDHIILNNLYILENIYGKETSELSEPWQKDQQKGVFFKGKIYCVILNLGLLLQNGTPKQRITSTIANNVNYVECYQSTQFIVKRNDDNILFDKRIPCFEAIDELISGKKRYIKINVLDNECKDICIQEKFDNGNYETFIPKLFFEKAPFKLPFVLTKTYTHWLCDNKILIKDDQRKIKFEIILQYNIDKIYYGQIKSLEHNYREVIPFDSLNKKLHKIVSNFEYSEYILVLKDNETPRNYTIYLPRLGLNFDVDQSTNTIQSKEYKDCYLASYQILNTLHGFKNYLILEPRINSKYNLGFKSKVLIPNHLIINKICKKGSYLNHIRLDLLDYYAPTYFGYELDENLGRLMPETIAGGLYLSLLYFKTSTLNKDKLTQLNGWETSSNILKIYCWQNTNYTSIELMLILRFFELDHNKLYNELLKSEDIYSTIYYSSKYLKDQHYNKIAIWLRIMFLLHSSLQTDYSEKKIDMDIKLMNIIHYVTKIFIPRYFKYYLVTKSKIPCEVRLSVKEELFILNNYIDKNNNDFVVKKCKIL